MKIGLVVVGRTDSVHLEALCGEYLKRLSRFVSFEMTVIPDLKNAKSLSQDEQKSKEGELILSKIQPSDVLVLLDEGGTQYTSQGFAQYLQQMDNRGTKRLVFVVGGPYGFSKEVYDRSDAKTSLSKMTFSHQMVRLFFIEQLYRAFSILNNLPYHHS